MSLPVKDVEKLKARFKELQQAAAAPADKKEVKFEQVGSGSHANNGKGAAAKTAAKGPRVVEPDDLFDADDLAALVKILKEDEGEKWLRVASRYHDRTGQRVHPDDVRKKFEQG